MSFIIDTRGSSCSSKDNANLDTEEYDESDDDFLFIPLKSERKRGGDSKDDIFELDGSYPSLSDGPPAKKSIKQGNKKTKSRKSQDLNSSLSKSTVLQPGLEKLESLPSYSESKRIKKRQHKAEQERTKGAKWFNLPAPEVTEEIKNDIEALQMRSALDPKHFYKKNDMKHVPKYFQIGKVVDSPADYYSSRIPKKERKRTLVDDLLADAEFQRQTKRRYKEIITERQKTTLHYVREKRRQQKKKGAKSRKSAS